MNTNTILLLAIPRLVVLAGLLIFGAARRRDTDAAIGVLSSETKAKDKGPFRPGEGEGESSATAPAGSEIELSARQTYRGEIEAQEPAPPPVAWVPPEPEAVAVSRRQFFNRSAVTLMGVSSTVFGVAIIGFLWPSGVGGFGGTITLGRRPDLEEAIDEGDGFAYFPEGRLWLTRYPSGAVSAAEAVYSDQELASMREGFVALWQTCPHLGCRVPECTSSQWFECPCHGSKYNRVGEHTAGPAPRGMDRFPASFQGNDLVVDTGETILGPPLGTNTTGQEAEGPFCV
jgi:cytochrome b6-f complex iron-sulfur subunit